MVYISYFCMIGDKTLGKICYCFPLMSIHGISKISEFLQILIADNSLTTEYVHWYPHPAVQLDLWGLTQVFGPLSFVYSGYQTLIRYMICKYFHPFCRLSFHVPHDVLWYTKGFIIFLSPIYLFFLSLLMLPVSNLWIWGIHLHCWVKQ